MVTKTNRGSTEAHPPEADPAPRHADARPAIDRRETVAVFRERLTEVINESGLNRSAFARAAGVERSTLSQLLSPDNDRLPRVDTLITIAGFHQASVDWLLGLSQEGQAAMAILPQSLEIAPSAPVPVDERLAGWHAEAVGYKIRYVPTTLPDLLKNEAVIRYEYQDDPGGTTATRVEESLQRLAYQRRPETDMEVCSPLQALQEFARGNGVWRDLDTGDRRRQLDRMIELVEELYPTFRWFLYDGRRHFSVPLTIFGPLRAVIYVGRMFFVFNGTEHIRVLVKHFDDLIRAAIVQPPDVGTLLRRLRDEPAGDTR
jgi:transcriptional regulator with XRE-family HTH domain